MKNFILNISFIFCALSSFSQDLIGRIEQVDVNVISQNSLLIVSTLGESVTGIHVQNDLALISGYFPVALFDSTGTTGIHEMHQIEGLEAWPNPAGPEVILSSRGDHDDFDVRVIDAKGQVAYYSKWHTIAKTLLLPLSTITPGLYHVRIDEPTTGRISFLKVIKH